MNYQQAYNFLISLNNIPRKEYMKDPRHCSWYLKRLQFFLNILGNPEKKISHYIHVTGTSGKGSVCLMLSSILRATEKKVGTLTSPHPSVILERWKINKQPMSKKNFAQLISQIKPKLDQYIKTTPYDMLSYGEVSTALALYYFARQKVDWAILEVGCGGRYDSTNIIPHKDIAVITNIGLDHKGTIGKTKKEIAYEKSGIIKTKCQVFTMEKNKEILKIIKKQCQKTNSNLQIVKYKNENYQLPILGEHQNKNAKLAIAVAEFLKIPNNKIKQGLNNLQIPVCLEIVSRQPLIILDGAHNIYKMKTTIKAIKKMSLKQLHLIIGFADNKQWLPLIKQLTVLKPKSIACTRFTNNPFRKAADPKKIAEYIKKLLPTTKTNIFLDPKDALSWSKAQNKKASGLILATGSIFLSGEIKNYC